ncbi:MAG TPA: serine--tRNA ligase [Patescibacteria group bacterium]|nr:serine--tRNA ligase [Patescibacteria group bacterium]
MIDINLLRKDPAFYRKSTRAKGINPDTVDEVLRFDRERLELLQKVEKLRGERNKITAKLKNIRTEERKNKENQKLVEQVREIKKKLDDVEPQLKRAEESFNELLLRIPNPPAPDVPAGKDESGNKEIRRWGEKPSFDFQAKGHTEIAEQLGLIDFIRGAKVAESGYYYLTNDAVLLELSLIRYGIDFLLQRGFHPVLTPDVARERYYLGTGYLPKGPEAQTYMLQDTDLGLIATAEVTIAGFHADELLDASELPIKYAGYSHCFRQEAGAYGKYSKGLYRVHQFTKVEMFMYTAADQSQAAHQELLKTEEEFWQSLGIPYRVLEMCSGDLGAQAVKKYDLEAWMPGRNDWGEITSTSNTTDYQARRLNIKYKDKTGTHFAHTLNGTLVATSRGIIAILENYQKKDGSVTVPEALRKYMGKDVMNKAK